MTSRHGYYQYESHDGISQHDTEDHNRGDAVYISIKVNFSKITRQCSLRCKSFWYLIVTYTKTITGAMRLR